MTDITITDKFDAVRQAIVKLLRAANGGSDPTMIRLSISDTTLPTDADEIADRSQRLHVTLDTSGRLIVALGIATHWKMLWSRDLAFCMAPSCQLFLQSFDTPPLYAWVEDDRLMLDRGSLLPTTAQQLTAMATFDADFASILAEAV